MARYYYYKRDIFERIISKFGCDKFIYADLRKAGINVGIKGFLERKMILVVGECMSNSRHNIGVYQIPEHYLGEPQRLASADQMDTFIED